jgi:Tol biopolymer transport system component
MNRTKYGTLKSFFFLCIILFLFYILFVYEKTAEEIDEHTILIISTHNKTGWNLAWFNIKTKKYRDLTDDGYYTGTTWSKDKKWVAFASGKGTSENPYHIWKMNIKNKERLLLTPGLNWEDSPAWSPDGKLISYLFHDTIDSPCRIFIMEPDGSHKKEIKKNPDIKESLFPSWSPDSKKIFFIGIGKNNQPGIFSYALDKEIYTPVYQNKKIPPESPIYSPAGSRIIFISNGNIFSINGHGADLKQLTYKHQDSEASWSPDGQKIIFTRKLNGKSDVWMMNADGSDQQQLTFRSGENLFPVWNR